MQNNIFSFLIASILIITGCEVRTIPVQEISVTSIINDEGTMKKEIANVENGTISHLNTSNTIYDVVHHSAFDGFGQFILPLERRYDENMLISQVSSLLPYHSNIDSQSAVEVINYMIDESESDNNIFYPIYEDEKMQENTGLFYFRGEENAPFAVVCAGGGFSYVGSIHEGFPLAIQLSEQGYNAFVIQYRTGGADVACEDLAAAISFIFANAEELKVSTENYSLWGGSAGARMAAYLGSHGTKSFGGDELPRASTVVMQYTGHSEYTESDPPTFAVIGENDGIASFRTMEQRINNLKTLGIDAEFHLYPNLGHGFGLGIDTSAEGWVDDAVAFWEKHLQQ